MVKGGSIFKYYTNVSCHLFMIVGEEWLEEHTTVKTPQKEKGLLGLSSFLLLLSNGVIMERGRNSHDLYRHILGFQK